MILRKKNDWIHKNSRLIIRYDFKLELMTFSDKIFEKYSKQEAEEFFHGALRDLGPVSGYHGYL